MYYHQNLRVQLQQRRNRLYKAVFETYQNELKQLLDFIRRVPYLYGLVETLLSEHPEVNWPKWKQEHFRNDRSFDLPSDETATAKVCYGLMCECAETNDAAYGYGLYLHRGSQGGTLESSLRSVTEIFIDPFINYLHDRIDEGSNVIYLLEKYKRRTEWFHNDDLFQRIQRDSSHSESILDSNLREYLFDQGIDYPFSNPASPSGKADVVADAGEEKPLLIEVKIFDPLRGYDKAYIRQGFRQIYDYCGDYGQSVGYLVIFNCSDFNIVFKTAGRQDWPVRIHIGDRSIFLVVVQLKQPDRPASKRGPIKSYEIEESYLTSESSAPV